MVLPAHLAAQAAELAPLLRALRLYLSLDDQGVLLQVQGAELAGLRTIVQGLLPMEPDLAVVGSPADLAALPPGSAAILVVEEHQLSRHGPWLNLHRTLFSDRALRVLLWCLGDSALGLAQIAPDFVDWLSHRLVYPAALRGLPPTHLICGLRALARLRAPGGGDWSPEQVHAALPRWQAQVVPIHAYTDLLRALGQPGRRLLCIDVASDFASQRLRWALTETNHRRPCLVSGEHWWTDLIVTSGQTDVSTAQALLHKAQQPGRLGVLLGLEAGAIQLARHLLEEAGTKDAALHAAVVDAADPGAVVGRLALSSLPAELRDEPEVGPVALAQSALSGRGSVAWQARRLALRSAPPALGAALRARARLPPDPELALAVGDIPMAVRFGGAAVRARAQVLTALAVWPFDQRPAIITSRDWDRSLLGEDPAGRLEQQLPARLKAGARHLAQGDAAAAEPALRAGLAWLAAKRPTERAAQEGARVLLRLALRAQGKADDADAVPLRAPRALALDILHAAADQGLAEELATRLSFLDCPPQVALRQGATSGDAVLALLSVDLLADDAALKALARARAAQRRVLPVLLRACDFQAAPQLQGLAVLPGDGRAVTEWPSQDASWQVLRAVQVGLIYGYRGWR